jgi:undecaprenyl-diphosphatase
MLDRIIGRVRATDAAQLRLPVLLALAAGGIWLFVATADEVLEGDTHAVDRSILLALRSPSDLADPVGPHWFELFMRDLTALGSIGNLFLLSALVIGYLLLRRAYTRVLLLLGSFIGGLILSSVLKSGFERPRPDLVPHGAEVLTASFPSGHAMLSAVVYLTLGAMVASVQTSRALRTYFLAAAMLLTVLIGSSRVYLGVHWPSDVLAGWAAGATWAIVVWLISRSMRRPKAPALPGENDQPAFESTPPGDVEYGAGHVGGRIR